jgi:TRAP-type C4-dicarboxylate transport system permease small subunit
MKGYKLTKRGQAVVLTLQILLVAVFMFFFIKAAGNAWDKEYEMYSQTSAQAADMYYESLPHK